MTDQVIVQIDDIEYPLPTFEELEKALLEARDEYDKIKEE